MDTEFIKIEARRLMAICNLIRKIKNHPPSKGAKKLKTAICTERIYPTQKPKI